MRPAVGYRTDIKLDESPFKTLYLCGVATGSKWEHNVHIAFRVSRGKTIEFEHRGLKAVIDNAVQLDIRPHQATSSVHTMRHFTCRNWQFAMAFAKYGDKCPTLAKAKPYKLMKSGELFKNMNTEVAAGAPMPPWLKAKLLRNGALKPQDPAGEPVAPGESGMVP